MQLGGDMFAKENGGLKRKAFLLNNVLVKHIADKTNNCMERR